MAYQLLHSISLLLLSFLLCVFSVVKCTKFKGSVDTNGGKLVFGNPVSFHRHKLGSAPIDSQEVEDEFECFLACAKETRCRSTNFKTVAEANGKFLCHLLDADKFVSPELFNENSVDHHHYSFTAPCELNPCMNGGTCQPVNDAYDFICTCTPGYYGKLCNVSYQSCADLLNAGYNQNGVYLIKPSQSDMFSVYCDQTSRGGGWTMVFKVISGVGSDISVLWSSADLLNEDKQQALNVGSAFPEHYKNRLVPNWQTMNPREARVAVYEKENEVLSIVFDAANSDNSNWFTADRVISSPWTDLNTNPPYFFTITGYPERPFYIASAHNGCDTDYGWICVSKQTCQWELRLPDKTVMYSKLQTAAVWSAYENIGIADVLIVYIR